MLTAFTSVPKHVRHPICKLLVWPPKVNLLVRTQERNSAFFQIPKSLALPGMTSFSSAGLISYLGIFILTSVNDTSSLRAWTLALMLHLTNACTKRKVLILTKPKGKIYKTRYLRNYITKVLLRSIWTTNNCFLLFNLADTHSDFEHVDGGVQIGNSSLELNELAFSISLIDSNQEYKMVKKKKHLFLFYIKNLILY